MAALLLAARSTIKTRIREHVGEFVLLSLVVFVLLFLFSPVLILMMGQLTDYGTHAALIQQVLDGTMPVVEFLTRVPHFLYHLLVLVTYWLVPRAAVIDAAYTVALAFYAVLAVTIYWTIRTRLGKPQGLGVSLIYAGSIMVLMLIGPVNIWTPSNLYLGYIAPHVYHNPTMVVLKPLAVLLSLLAMRVFEKRPTSRRTVALTSLVTALSILAKPSFMIALFPALVLTATYRLARRQQVNWLLLIGGIFIPAVVILVVQALFFDTDSFAFAPLAFFNARGIDKLPFKFIMSILFPVTVYAFYFREARHHFALNFTWLVFAVGAGYFYLFAEPGARVGSGNFTWTGQITLLVLFIMSFIFLLEQNRFLRTPGEEFRLTLQLVVATVSLGLHLWGGVLLYQAYASGLPFASFW